MRRLLLACAVCLVAGAPAWSDTAPGRFPGATWQPADLDAAGWSRDGLAKAEAWTQRIRSSADMVIQHGRVVAAWGDTAKRMELASVRKSLLDALIGIAVGRRQIDPQATLAVLHIDDNPPSLTATEQQATVQQLLEARSGVYHAALYETPAMAARRPPRGSHPPGTFWYYNNWDFNALGTIYRQATGTTVFQALAIEIAAPIGMQDYRPSDGIDFTGSASIHPAYPIRMSARDLARFAWLYLNEGRWGDRQLVPAQWVHDSTTPHSATPGGPGYGYLWWTGFLDDTVAPSVRLPAGSYFAEGDGGQFAVVIPAADLVVVHRIDRDQIDYRPTNLRELGRLLWLVLAADHWPDIGPDASIEAAAGHRLRAPALHDVFAGAAFRFGVGASGGPFTAVFGSDGAYRVQSGTRAPRLVAEGSWRLDEDVLCRTLAGPDGTRCYRVMQDGERFSLFDRNGLLQYVLQRVSTTAPAR